jgi:hypothetical protein
MKKLIFVFLSLSFVAQAQMQKFVAEITRPANATAYTAGDVVCGVDSVVSLLIPRQTPQGAGYIISARIAVDTANAANGSFRLFLYSDSTGSGKIADNAAHVNTYAKDLALIGTIDFTLSVTGNGSGSTMAYSTVLDQPMPIKVPLAASGVWGRLTATAGWVPNVSGKIRITLMATQ